MAPDDFHHPFQPYAIQQQFMSAMYDCIEDGKVGIFESPTGTGKTLSLLCASLTWLRQHKRRTFDDAIASVDIDDGEPDWMAEHAMESRRQDMRLLREELQTRLRAVREREQQLRERLSKSDSMRKRRKIAMDDEGTTVDENQFVLDDYRSDGETEQAARLTLGYSKETAKLMTEVGMLHATKSGEDRADPNHETKIYFCSRTHSQLSQLVGELKRLIIPGGMPPENQADDNTEPVRQLSLGSRKNLCINPAVAKLRSLTAVNERCVELQQSKVGQHRCPFAPNKHNEDLVLDFRDHALASIRDIEDLADLGSRLAICPYYASRSAIAESEIVTLPYPLLLHKTAREALGINLKNQIVIIDEAHNLPNAVEGIYSTEISEHQLQQARECLIAYLQRFRNRLKGSNRVYVAQVVRVLDSLLMFTAGTAQSEEQGGTMLPSQLLSGKGVDQVNLSKLVSYIDNSKLAHKVEGYAAYAKEANQAANGTGRGNEPRPLNLIVVQNFLMALVNPSQEGRFFWSRDARICVLRYMLLDPSEHFRDVVEEARSVILAGGTMSPMDDYRQQLFPYLEDLTTFSCGHLIPPSNLLVRAVSADEVGPLEFSFKSRNAATLDRIGRAIAALARTATGGFVVFLPSYGFLDQVAEQWSKNDVMKQLQSIKPVFWDNRTGSAEATFEAYTDAVSRGARGALLISVIGGKLSEGINFSDDLGRCVVVVGLPFPNLDTPEWKAKLQYLNKKAGARGEPNSKAGREHAENVCMRAVNQAVGRVIRHKDDWAGIVLVDARYSQGRIREKLPGWIRESFPQHCSARLADVVEDARAFYTRRQGK